ncbi:hypothetical protein PHLGIDRAFT_393985 [Phlebiopsis gigantea 11061_1 CR5-6]|uniref:Uncharacterized protein n=1 Tax=Phlebiopsis gigantea (strain 11061_1 CR5-6) TaxID=745531 RepID=A0A0C3PMW0_PHLG1|nr:hypothetical protein PHLGIDRAFT_393985 [Phlebiopsis gigantea 11061_1 CR5-6]
MLCSSFSFPAPSDVWIYNMALSTRLLLLALACTLLNGCVSVLAQELQSNSSQNIPRDMTNAMRLARGLPLKKPQFHRREKRGHSSVAYAAATQTSSSAAPASTPTAESGCDLVSGTIKVTSADGSLNGYVSSPNEEGLYGYCEEVSKAVTFTYDSCGVSPLEITGEPVESEHAGYLV